MGETTTITVTYIPADDMFHELGFKKFQIKDYVEYYNKHGLGISFDLKNKILAVNTDSGEEVYGNKIYNYTELDLDIIKAIFQKMKEENWLW